MATLYAIHRGLNQEIGEQLSKPRSGGHSLTRRIGRGDTNAAEIRSKAELH
jgi:hypothetical protein